ncbi:hypothetical protein FKM82_020814 [Ascaphus truei]
MAPALIAKKAPVSSGAIITKLIIAKPLNSKPLTSAQTTQVSSIFAGKLLSHTIPGTPPKTITITESGIIGTSLGSMTQTSNKIAISPLKSPSKLTVVSVASQLPNSPQKTLGVPISVALGQQLLTVQPATPSSPAKALTNNAQQPQMFSRSRCPAASFTTSGLSRPPRPAAPHLPVTTLAPAHSLSSKVRAALRPDIGGGGVQTCEPLCMFLPPVFVKLSAV